MRNTRTRLQRAVGLSLPLILFALNVVAQSEVPQRVVASGGTEMGSTNFSVMGTVGQPATGSLVGENTSAVTGYWSLPDDDPTAVEDTPKLPRTFSLDQNYPNPFNPTTTIRFTLPRESFVRLRVFDVSGKLVAELVNGLRPPGVYDEAFDASSLASGIYFYRIEAEEFVQSRKLVLLK